nr:dynein heavy chain domain-containing protein 1-like [Ciona intestinalis]|eukprot:XP_018667303.2 dynein heavy chain domain-containing protein 1-like [Ciona intestinalis]
MTSYQDHQSFIPTSPKFPPISAENSGIVNASSFAKRQSSSQWIGPLRKKLDYSISFSGQPHLEDVDELITEIIQVMINALQPNSSKQTWLDLNHVLAVIQPYSHFVASASISHYVERLFLHYVSNMDKLFDIPILDSLTSVFPRDISRAKAKYGVSPDDCSAAVFYKSKLLSKLVDKSKAIEDAPKTKAVTESKLPDGNNPYALLRQGQEPESYFKAKPLTIKTFSQNIGKVAMESAAKESTWVDHNSSTVAAISLDFPSAFQPPTTPDIEPQYLPIPRTQVIPDTAEPCAKKAEEFVPISGRQAVELFLQHKHLHKVKFIYLNKATSRHYSPYNLISVPRDHVDKEHFIFSSFGVLHILPNGTDSETFTLAEWNNNAVLWKAVHSIPFFHDYIPKKCFKRWFSNVKHIRYMRIRRQITSLLLHANPDFGSALLHIFRLIQELSEIDLLPDKPNQVCQYSLAEFEADAHKLKVDAENILELFFQYCKKVVDTTRQACFENLKYAEQQAKHSHPLYVKESLYIQRRKREARAKNLEKAKQITQQVPSFIALADQAISVHLVAVCRVAITRFVESVLCMTDVTEDPEDNVSVTSESHITEKGTISSKETESIGTVFATKFVFNRETHELEMNPSTAKFKSVMMSSISNIFNLVCHEAHSLSTISKSSITSRRPGSAPASIGSFSDAGSSGRSTVSSISVDMESVQSKDSPDVKIKQNNSSKEVEKEQYYMNVPNTAGLTEPHVTPKQQPTKAEDKDGVGTPDLLLSSGEGARLGLSVGGQRMMGNFNPLDHTKLKEKIMNDPEIAAATSKQVSLVESALQEVEDFCEEHVWIRDIKKFTSTWNEQELAKLKKKPARKIEELLIQVKAWSEKVKNMERSLVTTNRLIYVDCRQPYNTLVPALNIIFKKIIHMAMAEAKSLSQSVSSNAKESLKVLSNKDTNMKSFAAYAKKVTDSIKSKQEMSNKVTYIRSLYEVVRMTYRQLTQEEEKLDDRVKSTWEAFLFQLKDASNFVSNQQPIILKKLHDIFNAYSEQAEKFSCSAFEGIAVDPTTPPAKVISHLNLCISNFHEAESKMIELSRYHDSICGEPYDLTHMKTWSDNLNNRLSVWKFIDVYNFTVAEWGATNFRKFNCHTAIEKMQEWQVVANNLQSSLPPNDDVLGIWRQRVTNLSKELPLLSRLSSDAMKTRHWREVFTGMGESFQSSASFTVDDIITYKPSDHSDIINKIYKNASAEYSLDQLLYKVKQQWEKRQFQLAKHIYVINSMDTHNNEEVIDTGKMESAGFKHKERKLSFKEPAMAREIDSGTYTLVGVEEILRDLSDSHVTLQGMLQSKHATEIRNDAEVWSDTLQQIGEIVQLWVSCQDKWMYLNKVFCGDHNLLSRLPQKAESFKSIDEQYREFIKAMVQDPKVLSVLSRRHGQHGWREMQGEHLRKHLSSCNNSAEKLLYDVSSLLEEFRSKFPRLYFLSDDDCVCLLGISRQPRALLPYIPKCFHGAQSLLFSLPGLHGEVPTANASALDLELHSHKLQVTHLVGNLKEILKIDAIPAQSDAVVWFNLLEKNIQRAITKQLKQCVEERLSQDLENVSSVLEEVYATEMIKKENSSKEYRHWLLKYTSQAVLVSNSILWFRELSRLLKYGMKKEDLETFKKETIHKFNQFSQVMQENGIHVQKSALRLRLQTLLSSLVTQTAYHRDILRTFELSDVRSIDSYEWNRLIKHTADVVDYTNSDLKREKILFGHDESILNRSATAGRCFVEVLGDKEAYAYEYRAMTGVLGNTSGACVGTVITPITERCMLSLNLAIRSRKYGGLFGETAVGKSVVVSELAAAYGRQFISINCSQLFEINIFKRLLCGMVESGSWLCFDHAQRLTPTTLSILNQHISHIQEACTTIEQSTNTPYTVHGCDGKTKLKRSNSVTTLHDSLKDGTTLSWQPQISESLLKLIEKTRFEDSDAKDYLSEQSDPRSIGSIIFENKLLRVKPGFAVFMNFTTSAGSFPELPDSLRLMYRPACLIKPDIQKLIEVWLQAAGFADFINLSHKLHLMYQLIQANSDHISCPSKGSAIDFSATKVANIDLSTMKSIISTASLINCSLKSHQRSRAESVNEPDLLGARTPSATSSSTSIGRSSRRSEMVLSNHNEELAVVNAIFIIFNPKLGSAFAVSKFKENLRNIFPMSSRPSTGQKDLKLAAEIKQQMITDGLKPTNEWINKICELHTMIRLNQCVVMAGAAGSGKTTMYRILSKALNVLCTHQLEKADNLNDGVRDGATTDATMTSSGNLLEKQERAYSTTSVTSFSDVFTAHGETSHNLLNLKDEYSRVDVTVLFPNASKISDLFGYFDTDANVWKQGLIVKMLKDCTIIHKENKKNAGKEKKEEGLQPSAGAEKDEKDAKIKFPKLQKWIVFDGSINSNWTDSLNCLLDDNHRVHMSNMESLTLPKTTSVLFECADISSASPAVLSRCSILHCTVVDNWRNIASSWLENAYNLYAVTRHTVKVWNELIEDLVPTILKFLEQRNGSVLTAGLDNAQRGKHARASGIHEITSFFSILSSCLDSHSMRRYLLAQNNDNDDVTMNRKSSSANTKDETQSTVTRGSVRSRLDEVVPDTNHQISINLFGFAFVWSFGGHLTENEMQNFDLFMRDAIRKSRHDLEFPPYDTVFDYFVDEEFGRFSLWEDKIDLRSRVVLQNGSSYIPVHQMERYAYFSSILLNSQKSLLLVGDPGCGKSSLVKSLMKPEMDLVQISMSPGLTAAHFQRLIETRASPTLKQHNLGLMAHPSAVMASRTIEHHHTIFFLDDLSCTGSVVDDATNQPSVQPTLELFRQILCINGVYEHDRLLFKSLDRDIAFISTAQTPGVPGSGSGQVRQALLPSLTRNLVVLNFLNPTKETILSIYHDAVQSWLEEFPAYSLVRHYDLSQAIIAGAFDLYSTIRSHLKPSPWQPHYIFSLHDISHIMQGLFLMTPRARGRPIPLRRRGGANQMKRPRAGRQIGRYRSNAAWGGEANTSGVPAMMRTIVRLWLHECSRVFYDRLIDDHDRHWMTRSLFDVMKKHFCTGKDERPSSPAVEKVRIIKTPVPSAGSTPVAGYSSGSSSTDYIQSSMGEESDNLQRVESDGIESAQDNSLEIIDDDTVSADSAVSNPITDEYMDSNNQNMAAISDESVSESFQQFKSRTSGSVATTISKSSTSTATHVKIPSMSSMNEDMSETTTPTHADEYASHANTVVTEDDDTRSAVTGYTTELESVFESGTASNQSSTSETGVTSSTATKSEKEVAYTNQFAGTNIHPSSGAKDQEITFEKPDLSPQGRPSRPGGAKLGVTFMPGLIDDADVAANLSGPLISVEQVLQPNEESTSVLFSRGILSSALGQSTTADGYVESTEPQLAEALSLCLDAYNNDSSKQNMDLVFFGQAVRHAARLARSMSLKHGGHALLLSTSRFAGRKSLTRLIAHLTGSKLFMTEKSQWKSLNRKTYLRQLLKDASFEAGVRDKPVILMLDEPFSANPQSLDDICALVQNGQCPALYTHTELAKIAAEFAQGSSVVTATSESTSGGKKTALEKLDQNLETYFSRVLTNLHVVVLASFPKNDGLHEDLSRYKPNSLFGNNNKLHSFHQLLKRCPDILHHFSSVDLFREWNHESWQTVAHHFLQKISSRDDMKHESEWLPWSSMSSIEHQLTNLSHLMSFLHKDSLSRAKASLLHGAEDILNPITFKQMINMFESIARMIRKQEIQVINRYEKALRKVNQADDSLLQSKDSREQLLPKLEFAREHERSWKKHVEDERQEYTEARQRCSIEEDNIAMLEAELEQLRRDSQAAFDKVNPMHFSAVEILSSLNEGSFDEIKRYTKPPDSAVVVVTCLCHMFNVEPANWENGKALINKDKFFRGLEFYEKDKIPENIFQKIRSYVRSPEFKPEYIAKGSKAAESLCRWVHTIYNYSKTLRALQPKLAAQRRAEAKLFSAQATLGSKRVRCNQIKEELDSKIQMHKNASHAVKQFERELKNLDNQIEKAEVLMANMQEHVDRWKKERDCSISRLESAIGDASLTAACVAYHGVLRSDQRENSLLSWIYTCKNGYIDRESKLLEIPTKPNKSTEQAVSSEPSSVYSKSESESIWSDDDFATSSENLSSSSKPTLLKIRDDFSLFGILSTSGEQRGWHRSGVPRDARSRSDILRIHALNLHQKSSWCLFYDPDHQAETRINCILHRLKSDIENMEEEVNPSVDQSRVSTAASSLAESLGIIEDAGATSSSSYHSDTASPTETEITTSVSMAGDSQPDLPDSRASTEALKSRLVRFADEPSDVNDESSETGVAPKDEDAREMEEDQLIEVQKQATPPPLSLDELWVCRSTDPNLPNLLVSAMYHGAHLLITYTELRSLPSRALNIQRSEINPRFRLYLSLSISITHGMRESPGMFLLPPAFYAVTDLSLSSDGLEEKLEHIVLAQERPEFEAQRRLMEADIFHLEELYEQLHDNLLMKIAEIEGPVLHDPTVLKAIQICKRDATTTINSLHETKIMEQNLLQKKIELIEVSTHGRMLFDVLERVSVLRPPLYKFPASHFIRFYEECLKSRVRGKSSGGAATSGGSVGVLLKSRVVELKQGLTDNLLKLVEKEMFVEDSQTLCTLLSLEQLIKDKKMTRDEMVDLVGATSIVGEKPTESSHDLTHLHKPTWLDYSGWEDVLRLEMSHQAFLGLADSMSTKPKRWKEYLTSPPVLLGRVPCNKLHRLSLGQKALLWKTLVPDVLSKVISDLNTSVLGGVTTKPNTFYLSSVLPSLAHNKPCVFVLPQAPKDTCFIPSIEVKALAQKKKITFLQRSASFENDLGGLLERCMVHGHWLMLENCHLEQKWPAKFLRILSTVADADAYSDAEYRLKMPHITVVRQDEVTMRSVATLTDEDGQGRSRGSEITEEEVIMRSNILCHDQFRLWMVYRDTSDLERNFPGVLLSNAKFVTLEIPTENRDLVKKTHQRIVAAAEGIQHPKQAAVQNIGPSYWNRIALPYNLTAAMTKEISSIEVKNKVMVQLAVLHSILLQRSMYNKMDSVSMWTDGELESSARLLMMDHDKTARSLSKWMMTGHIFEQREFDIVRTIANEYMNHQTDKIKHRNLKSILGKLSQLGGGVEQCFEVLLQKPNFQDLGLHPAAETMTTLYNSRRISHDLEFVVSTELIRKGRSVKADQPSMLPYFAVHIKRTLDNYMQQIQETRVPDTNNSIMSAPMMDFFSAEVQRIHSAIYIIRTDLNLCLSMLRGDLESSSQLLALTEDIAVDRLPRSWLKKHHSLFKFHSNQSLSMFIKHLDKRAELLGKYINHAVSSATNIKVPVPSSSVIKDHESASSRCSSATQTLFAYNLAAFTRPDLFLQSLLFSTARAKFQDSHKCTFSKEFIFTTTVLIPVDGKLQTPGDFETVFIEGLYLHKAMYNKKTGILQESKMLRKYKMPLLKLTAEKKSIHRRSKILDQEEQVKYDCPIWINEEENPRMCSAQDVLTFVQIPTDQDPEQCLTNGVSICCSLTKE